MPNAYRPLHEYPYRYAPPIEVMEVPFPPRRRSHTVQSLVPDAAAMRYNVGGFNPGVSTACYARPKDIHALSLQPFDLALPGQERLPVDATLPTLRRRAFEYDDLDDFDDDDDDLGVDRDLLGAEYDDDFADDYGWGSRAVAPQEPVKAPRVVRRAPSQDAGQAPRRPLATAVQNVTSIPNRIIDAASQTALARQERLHASPFQPPAPPPPAKSDDATLKMVVAGLAGLVGGVVIGTMLARRG